MPRFEIVLTRPEDPKPGSVTATLDARDAASASAAARRCHPGYVVFEARHLPETPVPAWAVNRKPR